MRKILTFGAVLVLAPVAAYPAPAAQAGAPCNPYTQGTWSTRAAFPLAGLVRAWGAYFPGNGRFYALGGRTSDTAGSDLVNPREYDPVGDAWATKTAAFADNQVNNMVGGLLTVGSTPIIVLVGGSAAGATTATSEVRHYDPVADSMTTITTDPWPGNPAPPNNTVLPGGAAVFGNKLYVFGGFQIGVGMTAAIWEYDPAAAAGSRWTQKTATLPTPLGYIPTAASGSFVYMLGGSTFSAGNLIDDAASVRYDPVGDAVTSLTPLPRATGETRAVAQPFDGSIWVLGGGRTAPNPSGQVDVYLPGTNSWTTAPAFPTARRNFAADFDATGGRLWAVGGYPSATGVFLNVNEEFNCIVPVELTSFGIE